MDQFNVGLELWWNINRDSELITALQQLYILELKGLFRELLVASHEH